MSECGASGSQKKEIVTLAAAEEFAPDGLRASSPDGRGQLGNHSWIRFIRTKTRT